MQAALFAAPLALVAAFAFGGEPKAPKLPSAAVVALATLNGGQFSPAAESPAVLTVRGEWVLVGTKELDGLGPVDSVSPSGLTAGASLGQGLTFAGTAAVAVRLPDGSEAPPVVALYAVERPGLAFVVAPPLSGTIAAAIPPAAALDVLPVAALCKTCVRKPA